MSEVWRPDRSQRTPAPATSRSRGAHPRAAPPTAALAAVAGRHIVIAIFVITFIVQAFQIPSESMEKTLLVGDYLLVDKAHYGHSGCGTG